MKKILIISVLFLEYFLVIYSKEITKEFTLTINLFIYTLMPTMFFQIFLSDILYCTDFYKYIPIKICNKFNLNKKEFSIILLSMFSGYPNNIKLLSKTDNEYLNYASNYVNPLFVLGTVGNIYLKNFNLSIIILFSHILSNLIMLFLLRKKYNYVELNHKEISYTNSLKSTINTLSIILSNLLFISILVTLLKIVLPFNNNINSFLLGIIEFSRGVYEISNLNISIYLKGLLITIIITFQSISIHFQSISINNKIKYIKYLFYRLLNVLISIFIYFILVFIYTNV